MSNFIQQNIFKFVSIRLPDKVVVSSPQPIQSSADKIINRILEQVNSGKVYLQVLHDVGKEILTSVDYFPRNEKFKKILDQKSALIQYIKSESANLEGYKEAFINIYTRAFGQDVNVSDGFYKDLQESLWMSYMANYLHSGITTRDSEDLAFWIKATWFYEVTDLIQAQYILNNWHKITPAIPSSFFESGDSKENAELLVSVESEKKQNNIHEITLKKHELYNVMNELDRIVRMKFEIQAQQQNEIVQTLTFEMDKKKDSEDPFNFFSSLKSDENYILTVNDIQQSRLLTDFFHKYKMSFRNYMYFELMKKLQEEMANVEKKIFYLIYH